MFKIVNKKLLLYISKSSFCLTIFNKTLEKVKDISNMNKSVSVFSFKNELIIKYGNINTVTDHNQIDNSAKLIKNTIISKKQLKEFINNSKKELLIYTGAGMSRKSGIPTMKELKKMLFIDDVDTLLINALLYPEKITKIFRKFEIKLHFAKPTDFHYILKNFALKNNVILITENLDFLHEKSGITPLHSYTDYDSIISLSPKNVLLIGIGESMMKKVFQKWYSDGTNFVAINNEEVLINVPCKLFITDIGEIDSIFLNETN